MTKPTWNAGPLLYVGNTANGSLTIASGGAVIVDLAATLGVNEGTTGIIDVNGGILAVQAQLNVGADGIGRLIVRNGGTVVLPLESSLTDLGGNGLASSIQVSGGSFTSGEDFITRRGSRVEISGTGSVTSNNATVAMGVADVSGGSWSISDTLTITPDLDPIEVSGPKLHIRETGAVSARLMNIDEAVQVSGGALNVTQTITIGRQSNSKSTVTINGGQVTANLLLMGLRTGAEGALNLDGGVLSLNTLLGAINPFSDLAGPMTLRFNGGTLQFRRNVSEVFSGFRPGEVTIGPGGGTIETLGTNATNYYSLSGEGRLTKTGPGTLEMMPNITFGASDQHTYAGGTTVREGTMALTGSIYHPNGTLVVAGANNPLLTISGNGALTSSAGAIGTGEVRVSGGTWTNTGAITVGTGGAGTLAISGGEVTASALTTGESSPGPATFTLSGGVLNTGQVTRTGTEAATFTFGGGKLRLTGDQANLFGGFAPGTVTLAAGGGTIDTQGFNVASVATLSGPGALTKLGTGTLTLSGASTYTGGTTVTGGTISVGADTHLGDAGGALTLNGGTLRNTASFTTTRATTLGAGGGTFQNESALTYGGVISGSGALTKTGPGILILTGDNTYTGGTTIGSGSGWFQIGAGGTTGALLGDVVNNAYLFINRSDTYTLEGAVSGTGGLIQTSTGRTILTNDHTYAGGTFVYNGGTLQLGNGGTTGSVVGDVSLQAAFFLGTNEFSTLEVNRSNALTLDGVISGGGSLTQAGAGSLTLTGANTYTGATRVEAGKLVVNGSLAATAVTVFGGASLGGAGSFGGLVTLADGATLAPGNSPGTITFTDGLALEAGAILDFELGAVSDLILVTGGVLSGPDTGTVTLNITDSGGFTAGTYTLFDFGSGATLGNFSPDQFTFGSTLAEFTYSLDLVGDTLRLTASAIPEPSTYAAILGLAALGLAGGRRRRAVR